MDNTQKIYGLLGLAKRAGRLISGEKMCKQSILTGEGCFIIIASDSSENTKKNLTDSCKYYDVPYAFFSTQEELGRSIGNYFNAAVSVCDEGFANSIKKLMETEMIDSNTNGGE